MVRTRSSIAREGHALRPDEDTRGHRLRRRRGRRPPRCARILRRASPRRRGAPARTRRRHRPALRSGFLRSPHDCFPSAAPGRCLPTRATIHGRVPHDEPGPVRRRVGLATTDPACRRPLPRRPRRRRRRLTSVARAHPSPRTSNRSSARFRPSRRGGRPPRSALSIARLLPGHRLHSSPDPSRLPTEPSEQAGLRLLQDLILDFVVVDAELIQRRVERGRNRRSCRLHPLHRSDLRQRLRFFLLVRRPVVPGRAVELELVELVVLVDCFADGRISRWPPGAPTSGLCPAEAGAGRTTGGHRRLRRRRDRIGLGVARSRSPRSRRASPRPSGPASPPPWAGEPSHCGLGRVVFGSRPPRAPRDRRHSTGLTVSALDVDDVRLRRLQQRWVGFAAVP